MRDGDLPLDALARLSPARSGRARSSSGTAATEDISERRASQDALREETRALEILNTALAAAASELDLDRLVQRVTDAGVELTGAQFGAFFYNVQNEAGESYMLYSISGVPREAFSKFPMPRNTKVFAPTFNGETHRPLGRHHPGSAPTDTRNRIGACRRDTCRSAVTWPCR